MKFVTYFLIALACLTAAVLYIVVLDLIQGIPR